MLMNNSGGSSKLDNNLLNESDHRHVDLDLELNQGNFKSKRYSLGRWSDKRMNRNDLKNRSIEILNNESSGGRQRDGDMFN